MIGVAQRLGIFTQLLRGPATAGRLAEELELQGVVRDGGSFEIHREPAEEREYWRLYITGQYEIARLSAGEVAKAIRLGAKPTTLRGAQAHEDPPHPRPGSLPGARGLTRRLEEPAERPADAVDELEQRLRDDPEEDRAGRREQRHERHLLRIRALTASR